MELAASAKTWLNNCRMFWNHRKVSVAWSHWPLEPLAPGATGPWSHWPLAPGATGPWSHCRWSQAPGATGPWSHWPLGLSPATGPWSHWPLGRRPATGPWSHCHLGLKLTGSWMLDPCINHRSSAADVLEVSLNAATQKLIFSFFFTSFFVFCLFVNDNHRQTVPCK